MAFLSLVLVTRWRRWWRSWLALAALIALAAGLTMAGVTTARDTTTAFPRFVAAHGYDAFYFSQRPVPAIAGLPEVVRDDVVPAFVSGAPRCRCRSPVPADSFSLFAPSTPVLTRFDQLIAGRWPDPARPDEVLASYTFEQRFGVGVGATVRVHLVAPDQGSLVLANKHVTPTGPVVTLHVVGESVSEWELPTGSGTSYDLYATPAFARRYAHAGFEFDLSFVRLRHGIADLTAFQARARGLGGLSVYNLNSPILAAETTEHPQIVGWWILAALVALIGLLVTAQAVRRQIAVEGERDDVLRALGVTGRQLRRVTVARSVIVGGAGAIGGVGVAVALSPLTPLGLARLVDPTRGFVADPLVLGIGAIACAAITVALGWATARSSLRSARRPERAAPRSRVVAAVSAAGASAPLVIGVRRALERGRGRSAIPVGSALAAAILSLLALTATGVFGSSLTRLTHTPRLYGQNFDAYFSTNSTGNLAQDRAELSTIIADPLVADLTVGISGDVTIDGHSMAAVAVESVRGPLAIDVVSGRPPTRGNDVVLRHSHRA